MIDTILKIVGQVIPDPKLKAKVQAEVAARADEIDKEAVIGTFKEAVELAKHPSLYVAGARPTIIWFVAIANAVILAVVLKLELDAAYGVIPEGASPLLMQVMWTFVSILGGMFGWRSVDKWKGIARSNLK